jgi:hypothetical protein
MVYADGRLRYFFLLAVCDCSFFSLESAIVGDLSWFNGVDVGMLQFSLILLHSPHYPHGSSYISYLPWPHHI